MELQHDVHRLNNIINPIPPLVDMEKEEDLEMFVEDDGWEEEEEEQLVYVDNDDASTMSGVDSDHSEA